jgi:hypothetical protein
MQKDFASNKLTEPPDGAEGGGVPMLLVLAANASRPAISLRKAHSDVVRILVCTQSPQKTSFSTDKKACYAVLEQTN